MKSPEIPEFSEAHNKIIERAIKRERGRIHEVQFSSADPVSAETYKRLFDRLVRPGDRIVNVGAGFAIDPTRIVNNLNGEILDACVKKDATLVAVDVDYKNLLTHKDLKELTDNKNLEMLQADAMNMPLGNESVSGIVSGNLINCPSPEMRLEEQADRLAEEAWRLLRPGGFLLLSSFGYGLIEKDRQGRDLYNNDLRKEDLLTLKQLEKILTARGFKDISELETDPHIERFLKEKTGALRVEEGGGFIAYKPRP